MLKPPSSRHVTGLRATRARPFSSIYRGVWDLISGTGAMLKFVIHPEIFFDYYQTHTSSNSATIPGINSIAVTIQCPID
ncbi:hypothetical protein HanHA300_Chr10g0350381 [Helianthus annuus]|nr:hypothetical protein HanHA300_Chr10g0350381 [Helianthus annuus]KAJ0528928.1 hypothetical protein HanHA89_Chr10g0371931 [Helianthus annuus]KAJ0695843.1 hypothetical protein HanLR1_Chr10g0350141 [Helianthus annuus]